MKGGISEGRHVHDINEMKIWCIRVKVEETGHKEVYNDGNAPGKPYHCCDFEKEKIVFLALEFELDEEEKKNGWHALGEVQEMDYAAVVNGTVRR